MAQVDTNKRPVTDLIASREQTVGFDELSEVLPNPDPVLKAQGKDIQIYRDLLVEPLVMGATARLEGALAERDWELQQNNAAPRVVKGIGAWLAEMPVAKIVERMINGYYYGYQPLEVMWQTTGQGWWPDDVLDKPAEWFGFGKQNELRFFSKANEQEGVPVPERRILLARHKSSYHNPYGMPVMSACFWPVTFKRGGLKFWLKFTEKYGMPFLIGELPRTATPDEYQDLADKLWKMVQDAIAVIPDDGSIRTMEAAGKGASAELYEKLMYYCRSEINIALLGQNQTTESSANRASATAGLEVTGSVEERVVGMVESTFNELIEWVVFYNYGQGTAPRFKLFDQQKIDEKQSERDKRLHSVGLRFSSQYFVDEYGIKPEHIAGVDQSNSDSGKQEPVTELAEGEHDHSNIQNALDDFIQALPASDINGQSETALAAVFDAIANAADDAEVLGLLADVFPDMDDSALQEALTHYLFIAQLIGEAEVQTELEDN